MKQALKKILRKNKYLEILAYILQNNQILNSSGSGEFGKTIDEMYSHGANVAKLFAENYDGNLENKVVLEIGTGYTRATMLYMIKEYNLQKAYCYDRFNCLHENDNKIIEKYNLEPYLEKLEYISGINKELLKIENLSIDYVVSNAVLEHVDTLELLFSVLEKVLKIDGQMYHKVDLRCHNRFKIHGELYFHTFGEKFWNMMGGNIGQPNRKLLKDYLKLFDTCNLECSTTIFEQFSEEELKKAKSYLKIENLDDYKVAVAEFKLCKK
ncbi:methyltransferase domain-containing protein [Malaciobacter marinus]|jgi:SAM-dependent methyltransferase|uniref:methyltransferase domain-containing protein n=1 Tax=Malaciobacter marinus TaxID=505249 RepID=UPI0009A6B240|nr:methyltransferase domain-containing protein [Malaciobacter marinus]SKB26427.1 Methyltransferase domain-containing protein [Malaciobacter marinus]